MKILGTLLLRDRPFQICGAIVSRAGDLWTLEIETLDEEYDEERWRPSLYHQGLKLNARYMQELTGLTSSWQQANGASYPHPELGVMYVFGHEPVYDCSLKFGRLEGDSIELEWKGMCDVFWDEAFRDKVPFSVQCKAKVSDV